jgi:hypothetical protein
MVDGVGAKSKEGLLSPQLQRKEPKLFRCGTTNKFWFLLRKLNVLHGMIVVRKMVVKRKM